MAAGYAVAVGADIYPGRLDLSFDPGAAADGAVEAVAIQSDGKIFVAAYQLIEGDLYMAPAPNRYHQDISVNIQFIIRAYPEKHPIGKLYDAPFDVYLNENNVFQPDLVFVSKKNSSILTDAGAEGAPDFIVEILSPKTAG